VDVPAAGSGAREAAPAASAARFHGMLLAVQVAFASLSVVGKVVLRSLEPGAIALVRLAGAALVFAAIAAARAERGGWTRIPFRDVLAIAGCACLGIFGNQVLFLYGLRLTSPVNATVLIAAIPVFTVLIAILLGREKARAKVLGGIAIASAGVVWLVGAEAIALGAEGAIGDLLVLANSLVYALYLVLVRDLALKHGSLPVVTIGFAVGAALALPIGVPALAEQGPALDASTWALLAYAVLVPTVFTYLASAWALEHAPSSTVATYVFAQPPVAAVLAWIVLGEVPSARLAVAAVLVFAGIWLVTRPAPREAA
jgi:drug/metabolite transporter (DMT)-like permease